MSVRIITISHASEENKVGLYVWSKEYETPQKAIDWLNEVRYLNGLSRQQNLELRTQGFTTTPQKEAVYILHTDEQKQWIKTLVKELV
jgi:hypothetical protein